MATRPPVPAALRRARQPRPERRPWWRRLLDHPILTGCVVAVVGGVLTPVTLAALHSAGHAVGGADPVPSTSFQASGDAPFRWTVQFNEDGQNCAHFAFAKPISHVPVGTVRATGTEEGMLALGGADAGMTDVTLALQGTTDTPVVIQAIHVQLLTRTAVPAGVVTTDLNGCGAGLPPRLFQIDLDQRVPRADPQPGQVMVPVPSSTNDFTPSAQPPVTFPYEISRTDVEDLIFHATTAAHRCTWLLWLDWSSQGRTGRTPVRVGTRPFATSGTAGLPVYGYNRDGGWVRQPAD
jgi:hypothetical protein